MFKNNGEFSYTVGKIDEFVEEKGSQFTALREVYYNDSEKPSIELRRYSVNKEGNEQMAKGVVFMTPTGPQEAAKAIIRAGFGETTEYIQELKDTREDFDQALNKVLGPDDKRYDPDVKMDEVFDASTFVQEEEEDEEEYPF